MKPIGFIEHADNKVYWKVYPVHDTLFPFSLFNEMTPRIEVQNRFIRDCSVLFTQVRIMIRESKIQSKDQTIYLRH